MNHKKTSRKALKKASVALAMTVGILSGMLVTAEAKTDSKQSGSSIYSEGEVSDFAGSSYILGAKKGTSTVNVEEVKLNKAKADITVGKTVKLTAKVLPEDATDKTVRWSVIKGGSKVKLYSDSDCKKELGSKATDLLTVYAKGINPGTATIEVESHESSGIHDECSIKVSKAPIPTASKDPNSFSYMKFRLKDAGKSTVSFAWDKVPGATRYVIIANFLTAKNAKRLDFNVEPSRTSYTLKNLQGDTEYRFTIRAYKGEKRDKLLPGRHHIIVRTKAKSGSSRFNPTSVQISKSEVSLEKNDTYKISATVKGSGTSHKSTTLHYESTDPKIASVDKSGVIKAHKKGGCYIYAYAQSGVFDKIAVTVK